MPSVVPPPAGPVLGGLVRRVAHTLVALAGWTLFVYWWWLVARHVTGREVRFTLVLIAVALVGVVSLTVIWAVHNARIYRRRGPRRANRPVAGELPRDTVGREVRLPRVPDQCRTAAVVRVRVAGRVKTYAPEGQDGPR